MYYKSTGLEDMIRNEGTSDFPEKMCQVCAVLQQGPIVALTSTEGSLLWWLARA